MDEKTSLQVVNAQEVLNSIIVEIKTDMSTDDMISIRTKYQNLLELIGFGIKISEFDEKNKARILDINSYINSYITNLIFGMEYWKNLESGVKQGIEFIDSELEKRKSNQ